LGAVGLLALLSGCEAPGVYGGGYVGVSGEYPTTYSGYGSPGYYSYYPYGYRYGYREHYHHPYDRDHYWDRDRHWDRHRYHFGDRDY